MNTKWTVTIRFGNREQYASSPVAFDTLELALKNIQQAVDSENYAPILDIELAPGDLAPRLISGKWTYPTTAAGWES